VLCGMMGIGSVERAWESREVVLGYSDDATTADHKS